MTRDTSSPAAGSRSLAARHVPLVAHLVQETMTRVPAAVDRNDLRAAGLSALLDAARGIEMTSDRSFVTRATIAIRGALVDELRATDWAARAARPRSRAAA
ncbi:MAG TPA: FliA/WhiG family RNA polymerase sigma factor, partial [Nocardioides sp.]